LEHKALLSAAGVATPQAATALVARPVARHHIALNGAVGGTWTIQPGIPDVGQTQTLKGSGAVQPLGAVTATGTLHATGFIAMGHAGGTITLSNDRGSVTLQLTGPTQRGFSPLPRQFTYRIVAATGDESGATDSGAATLVEVLAAGDVPGPSTASPPIIVGPLFSLTLHSTGA
jgi:hypothetical protein